MDQPKRPSGIASVIELCDQSIAALHGVHQGSEVARIVEECRNQRDILDRLQTLLLSDDRPTPRSEVEQMADDALTTTFAALTYLCYELKLLPQAPPEKIHGIKRLSKWISRDKTAQPLAGHRVPIGNQTQWLILVDELLRMPSTHDDIDKRLRKKGTLVEGCKKHVLELQHRFPDLLFPDSILSIKRPHQEAESPSTRNEELGDEHMPANFQKDNSDKISVAGPESPPTTSVEDYVLQKDLWQAAFQELRKRNQAVVVDYEEHIQKHLLGKTGGALTLSSPASVTRVVRELVDYRQANQWQFDAFKQTVTVREQVENLLKFLVWSDNIVKEAISSQPYLALAWTGVSIFLPLVQNQLSRHAVMLDGFNTISRIQVFWRFSDESLSVERRKENLGLTNNMVGLYTDILEYQARVINHLSRTQTGRGKADAENALGGFDWKKMTDDIEKADKACQNLLARLDHQEIKMKWHAALDEISESRKLLLDICSLLQQHNEQSRKQLEGEKEAKLLRILPSNYSGGKDFNPKRVHDTCSWFLDDPSFLGWRGEKKSSLLWLSAGPGCGKSVLARSLIDKQELVTTHLTSTVCYFFFKSGIEERTHSTDALSAMLHQVLTLDMTNRLTELALRAYTDCGAGLRTNFDRLWGTLLDCAKSPDSGQIICVFDALDECDEKSRGLLLDSIQSFLQSSDQLPYSQAVLKFLVTSRPIDTIVVPLSELDGCDRFFHVNGDARTDDIAGDITLYIEDEIRALGRRISLGSKDRHDIANLLREKGNRTYLWVQTIFSEIWQNPPSKYGRGLDIKTLIESTPSDLWEVYEKSLNNCPVSKNTRKLLELVLAATRPLTLDEANILLTMSTSATKYTSHAGIAREGWSGKIFPTLAQNTGGLLIVVYDGCLHLIHETVRDFLVTSEVKGNWQGRFRLASCHGALRDLCVDYLLLDEFREEITAEQIVDDWYPLYQYAADNWLLHHASGGSATPNGYLSSIERLCDEDAVPQSKTWMEIYGGANNLNIRGTHSLNVASFLGLGDVIDYVLSTKAGDSINRGDSNGWTPLLCACAVGEDKIVEKLLGMQDINVNHRNRVGQTALMLATSFGHGPILDMLLSAKTIEVNAKDQGQGWTALMYAVHARNGDMIEKLLAAPSSVDADITDANGETALQHAASRGNGRLVEFLSGMKTDQMETRPTNEDTSRSGTNRLKEGRSMGLPAPSKPAHSSSSHKQDEVPDVPLTKAHRVAAPSSTSISSTEGGTERTLDVVTKLLQEAMQTSYTGRYEFLPIDALLRIITSDCAKDILYSIGVDSNRVEDLAKDICGSTPKLGSKTSPVTLRQKILAILLLIGEEQTIPEFVEQDISDRDLPFQRVNEQGFHLKRNARGWSSKGHSLEDPRDWVLDSKHWTIRKRQMFYDTQWVLLAPYFRFSTPAQPQILHYILEDSTPLPIVPHEISKYGGFAKVEKVAVYPGHCTNLSPRAKSKLYFAVKSLYKPLNDDGGGTTEFWNEVSTLKRLSRHNHPHVINLLATFSQHGVFSLIYQWADGDLADFWGAFPACDVPWRSSSLAQSVMKQVLGLIDGLQLIHNAECDHTGRVHPKLLNVKLKYGRHGDIKPGNILWFSGGVSSTENPGQILGSLKIADFGLTRFDSQPSGACFAFLGNTFRYAAPEIEVSDQILPANDVWSLGCVLLEFLTWYLLGGQGIEKLDDRISKQGSRIDGFIFKTFWSRGPFVYRSSESSNTSKPESLPSLDHQDIHVSSGIRDHIRSLRNLANCPRFVLDAISIIENAMLIVELRKRATIGEVFDKMEAIYRKCKTDNSYCTYPGLNSGSK